MKKYLYISAIILACLFLSNLHYRNLKINENHIQQWNYYLRDYKPTGKEILVLGDSYSAYSIWRRCNLDIVNFAYPGDHYGDMFFKLKSFSVQSKPSMVLLALDPHLFKKDPSNLSLKYHGFNRGSGKTLLSTFPLLDERNRIEYGKILSTKLLYLLRNRETKSIYYDQDMNLRRAVQYRWDQKENKGVALRRSFNDFFSKPFNIETNLIYLDSIINYCSSEQIPVLVNKSPISSDYAQLIDSLDSGVQTTIASRIESLIIHNYDYSMCFENADSLFMDPVHLNDLGAVIFSKKLCSDLEKISSVVPDTITF